MKTKRLKSLRSLFETGQVRFRLFSAIKKDPLFCVVLRDRTGRVSIAQAAVNSLMARTVVNAWNTGTESHGLSATAHKLNLRGCLGPERQPVDLGPSEPVKFEQLDDDPNELQTAMHVAITQRPLYVVVLFNDVGNAAIPQPPMQLLQARLFATACAARRDKPRVEIRPVDLGRAILSGTAIDLAQGGAA